MEMHDLVMDALRQMRCPPSGPEMQLHEMTAAALEACGLAAEHEARLGPGCRIDFLVGDIGIEVKKSRPQPAALRRQLARYAACGAIGELIVIAPRGVNLPPSIGGKRVTMLGLDRLWGISLP
ncbi:MAG: hypothetical protein J6K32_07320 [Clostridia bacterium]|nr:hypothetical protein [Clostridia bacterium]